MYVLIKCAGFGHVMKGEPVLVIYCESCYKDFQFDTSFAIWAAYDKTNNVSVRTAKTQISLGIRPVWSESSLSAWRKLRPLATDWARGAQPNCWFCHEADHIWSLILKDPMDGLVDGVARSGRETNVSSLFKVFRTIFIMLPNMAISIALCILE